jgi:hypothetical protein
MGYYPPPPRYFPPPKPGVIPLRPLAVGEILDGAITTIRRYPKQMLGLTAIVSAIGNLVLVGVLLFLRNETDLFVIDLPPGATQLDQATESLKIALIAAIPSILLNMFIKVMLSGMLTVVVGKAVLGHPVTAREAWAQVWPRFWSLLGASLLYTLAIVAGLILFVVPGIWLYVLFSLATSALILEGAKVGRSFGRSRELLDQAWWRTFGILLLASIIAGILAYIIGIPFNLITGTTGLGTTVVPSMSIEAVAVLITIGGILADTITLPFVSGVTTLLYIDRRIRREGLDIELARQASTA